MKIAYVAQSYPPMVSGASIFTENLAEGMARRGHQVLVLAASDLPDPYTIRKDNLEIARFKSHHNPLRRGQRFTAFPYPEINQRLACFDPAVIHLQDPLQLAVASLSFSQPRNTPVLITIHGLPSLVSATFRVKYDVRRILEAGLWSYGRWILTRCDRVVTATQSIARTIHAHTGILPATISSGINLDLFTPAPPLSTVRSALFQRLGIPEEAPVILHVGRLDKDKQVEQVVQAAGLAMRDHHAHLLVVGDGTERVRLERTCARLGIARRSHFPGFITVKDGLPAIYQSATVFVTASEIETQGVVLLEAAACGLPLVAYRSTCLHEIVSDGENGFLVAARDVAQMADRIAWLLENPEAAAAMGKASREKALIHASERTLDAYERIYAAMLETAQPQRRAPSSAATET